MTRNTESRLVWDRVKDAAGDFVMERQEDRSAGGRPDVLWCLPGKSPVVGRLELKYMRLRAKETEWGWLTELQQRNGGEAPGNDRGRTSTVRATRMNSRQAPVSPYIGTTTPIVPPTSGLRIDQALVLGRWGMLGVPCGCLQRIDAGVGSPTPIPVWLYYAAPSTYPVQGLGDWPVSSMAKWASAVAGDEAWRLVSRFHVGRLTTTALRSLLLGPSPLDAFMDPAIPVTPF